MSAEARAEGAWAGARREELRARLQALGFDEVRFAQVEPGGGGELRAWLAEGGAADMAWIGRSLEQRLDVRLVLPGARTVIMLGVNYLPPAGGPAATRWARYAQHEDYHDSLKAGLRRAAAVLAELGGGGPDACRYYTDTGPLLERGWAARAGLGFRGKNGMLISRRHGNWLLLAALVTRQPIAPDAPLRRWAQPPAAPEPAGLLCGKCTRCSDACPTRAIPRPGVVDARRCISYQTIENRGVIPRELRPGIGDRLFGCDVCLEVCPWNRFAQAGRSLLLVARPELGALTLGEVLALTPERFAAVFRRTAVKRTKLGGLLRNACVVAGNSGDAALVPALVALAGHEAAVVRAHAVWAVRRLAGAAAPAWLAEARAREADPAVQAEHEGAV